MQKTVYFMLLTAYLEMFHGSILLNCVVVINSFPARDVLITFANACTGTANRLSFINHQKLFPQK